MKTKTTRLILFDIDGTLIRSGGAGVRAFAQAFAKDFGVAGADRMNFAGRTDVSLVRECFLRENIAPSTENFARFFDAYIFWLQKYIVECAGSACPGVLEFFQALEAPAEPPMIGLLTGNIRRGAEIKLKHYQLWDKFPFGGFADDHEDRDLIAAAAHRRGNERLGRALHGQEVVVIGDTPSDIRCGRAIGAKVLAVATGQFTVEQLREHKPDWAVRDLNQISPADL